MTIVRDPSVHQGDVLHIEGPLRAPLSGELAQRVRALLHRGGQHLVLDLARVSTIDAGGLGELVAVYNMTLAAGGALQIVHATARVREILQRVGLFGLLSRERIHPGATGASEDFGGVAFGARRAPRELDPGRAREAMWTTICKGCRVSN
jgi:anti-anti-sigma factor